MHFCHISDVSLHIHYNHQRIFDPVFILVEYQRDRLLLLFYFMS